MQLVQSIYLLAANFHLALTCIDMASVLKVQKANAASSKGKRKADDMDVDQGPPAAKRLKNKQRVLLLSSRGITHRMRHLMNDLEVLLPHVKRGACLRFYDHWDCTNLGVLDSKLDSKNHLHLLPELADLNNCNNTLYFEARRHEDLYLWAAKTPNGPSVKMHVQNVHTMDELKMTGNCLKGSRGLVSFDSAFDDTEWGRLVKELFTHVSRACDYSLFSDSGLSPSNNNGIIVLGRFLVYRQQPEKQNRLLTISSRFPSLIRRFGSGTSRSAFLLFFR